jgi:ADP-ribose pyrophosphatase YjhB (NUDIX family)
MSLPVPLHKIEWNKFEEARPYITVGAILVNSRGQFPIMFRGPKVRAAKNAWSIITGLHEVGIPFNDQLNNECKEELNLSIRPNTPIIQIGWYENIDKYEDWHWMINVVVARVDDETIMKNMEPDKHTEVRWVTQGECLDIGPWTPGIKDFMIEKRNAIREAIEQVIYL